METAGPLQLADAVWSEVTAPLFAALSVPPPSPPASYREFAAWRRRCHEEVERLVRASGLEYVIVRAPPLVENSRPGAVEALTALSPSTLQDIFLGKGGRPSLCIGALDLAEAAVQSLLLEQISGVSFTVAAASSVGKSSVEPTPGTTQSNGRASRETYYSILSLDDSVDEVLEFAAPQTQRFDEVRSEQELYADMRSTYIIRCVDSSLHLSPSTITISTISR
jgi:hypothetical protein